MTTQHKAKNAAGAKTTKHPATKQLGSQHAKPHHEAAEGLPGPSANHADSQDAAEPVMQCVKVLVAGSPGVPLRVVETHPEEHEGEVYTVTQPFRLNGLDFAAGDHVGGAVEGVQHITPVK